MTKAETQYFILLRAALWDTPVDIDGPVDWEAVMRIAEHHGNDALLSDVAFHLEETYQPSAQLAAQMQNAIRFNLFTQMKLKQIMVSAIKLLREHNIEPVVLKGFGLALLYSKPNLRQFGDIDLFVGLDDFHPACAVLRTMQGGYTWGEEVDVGRHYNIEFGQYPMEIHRVSADIDNPKEAAYYNTIEQDGLVDNRCVAEFEGFKITIPSKELQVFFTFYHAWHHFLETGVGWRQLSDVALALHTYHQQLDTDKLNRWLVGMNVMLPWKTFGWLLVECLGLPAKEMPFYDPACRSRAMRLYGKIMKEGYFKRNNTFKYNKPHTYGLRHKMHSFIGIFVDLSYVASVFPVEAFHEMTTTLKLGLVKNFQKK